MVLHEHINYTALRGHGKLLIDTIFFEKFLVVFILQMMKLNSSERSVEAGSNISISINSTAPYAFVGLRAVDQRVWLLQPRNNISRERVRTSFNLCI